MSIVKYRAEILKKFAKAIFTGVVNVNNISKVKYPELDSIERLKPNPEILLGKEIVWQEKRDGSNLGVRLSESDDLEARTRRRKNASEDFFNAFINTEEAEKVRELLVDLKHNYNDECVVFGELLREGKSPTKVEFHEKDSFVVFDIWSSKMGDFVTYTLVHQHCYNYGIPVVSLYGVSKHVTIESLYSFRDKMLDTAKESCREGVVGKTYERGKKDIYFKARLDTPKYHKKPRHIEEGVIVLPPLPDSEVLGALNKVFVDYDIDVDDKRKVMPIFAKYVSEECEKHNCGKPEKSLYSYYLDFLRNK